MVCWTVGLLVRQFLTVFECVFWMLLQWLYLFVLQSWRAFRCIDALLMMAEHPPLLDTAQILSSDISLLSAPIVSADGTQQVRKQKCILPHVLSLFCFVLFFA